MKKSVAKKKGEAKITAKSSANTVQGVGSYEKHPFFVKKASSAKALLKKVGLPVQLTHAPK